MYTILLIVLAVVTVSALAWRRKRDPREPPFAPGSSPILGHIPGLIKHRNEYYTHISKISSDPIVSLKVPLQQMYVVTSPALVSKVQKVRTDTLSFEPIKADASTRIYDPSPHSDHIAHVNMQQEEGDWGLAFDFYKSMRVGLRPGAELNDMNRVMIQDVLGYLNEIEPPAKETRSFDLLPFLRGMLTAATTNATYGPLNPYKDEKVGTAFWKFEDGVLALLLMPFQRIFVRSAIKAREIVVAANSQYIRKKGVDSAGHYTKLRFQAYKQNNILEQDIARYEIGIAIAGLSNSVPACFWMIMHIYRDQELLKSLRQEIDAVTKVEDSRGQERTLRTLCISNLKTDCPLLLSVFQETLRTATSSVSVRKVLKETMLDNQWLLKKDAVVMVSNRAISLNEQLWGKDAHQFNARRFVKGEKQQTESGKLPGDAYFRAFGGGHHLCPGRHFASNEILATCALFVARYDLSPSEGSSLDLPTTRSTPPSLAILRPDTNVVVKVKQREGVQDSEWHLTLSQEDEAVIALGGED